MRSLGHPCFSNFVLGSFGFVLYREHLFDGRDSFVQVILSHVVCHLLFKCLLFLLLKHILYFNGSVGFFFQMSAELVLVYAMTSASRN